MKTLLFSCLLLGGIFAASTAQAQFIAGADAFASAGVIPPEGGRSAAMDLRTCTLESGEVLAVANMQPKTAWWRWTAPEDGFCVAETVIFGSQLTFDVRSASELGVFTGSSVTNLTKVATGTSYRASASSIKLGVASRFFAQKGRTYYVQVGATTISDTRYDVVLRVTPLPTKSMTREAVWTHITETGQPDVAGLSLQQNVSGTLSGKLRLRSGTYPFTAVLDHMGTASVSLLEKQKKGELPRGAITLSIPGFKNSNLGAFHPSGYTANAFIYDTLPLEPLPVGPWTGYMTSGNFPAVGTVTMKVSPSQSVSVALRFLDGTAVTHSGRIMSSDYGAQPQGLAMMKILSGGKSAFQGSGSFNPAPGFTLFGSARYIRQEKVGATFYPTGISTVVVLFIGPYTKPAQGQRALGFLNAVDGVAKMRITDPNNEMGGDVDLPLTFDSNNKFVFATDTVRKPTLKLNTATGQVTGSVILGGKKRSILGTLANSAGPVMQGYVTGTRENVKFEVIP